MPQRFARYFAGKHPLFRSSSTSKGVWWERNIYYLWWEFLRRHEGYKTTCQMNGRGKYSSLYKDFGNVHATDFKTWWNAGQRGEALFAEPPLPLSVDVVQPSEIVTLTAAHRAGQVIFIAVPLDLRKREISRKIIRLLKTVHPRKRGQKSIHRSDARYPLTAKSTNIPSLRKTLEVYDFYKANPALTLWEIGHHMMLGRQLTEGDMSAGRGRQSPETVDKKNALAAAASRKIRIAHRIIAGTVNGRFPTGS